MFSQLTKVKFLRVVKQLKCVKKNEPWEINVAKLPLMLGKPAIRSVVRTYDWEYAISESCDLSINKPIPTVIIFTPAFIKDSVGGKTSSEDFPARSTTKTRSTPLTVVVGNSVVLQRVSAAPALQAPPISWVSLTARLTSNIEVNWLKPNTTWKN